MRTIVLSFAFLFAFVITAIAGTQDTIISKKNGVFIIGAEKVDPMDKPAGMALGTGFLIAENQIVTNAHVVANTGKILVKLENSPQAYEAKVLRIDSSVDIALLEMKDWKKFASENDYEILRFVNSINVKQLDEVYTVGNPWGLLYSISKGVVSGNIRRDPLGALGYFIQTDAYLFEGNSGGPLLNADGDVVGINSDMIVREGGSYGLAIHADIVKKVLNDWKHGRAATWANAGILISNDTTVKDLLKNGPAMRAGIQKDDKIIGLKVNKRLIKAKTGIELTLAMASTSVGDQITLIVKRNGTTFLVPVKPDYRPIL